MYSEGYPVTTTRPWLNQCNARDAGIKLGFVGLVTAPGFVPGINARNLLELLPIIGAVLMMLSVFAKGEQTTRKFLLANASVWTVYTGIVGSSTFIAEVGAVIADCVALYKYRGTEK